MQKKNKEYLVHCLDECGELVRTKLVDWCSNKKEASTFIHTEIESNPELYESVGSFCIVKVKHHQRINTD